MIKYDDSFVFLRTWQRVLCGFVAALMLYNYMIPWPPVSKNRFAIGFFGVLGWSLMAIFGNKVRGARLLSGLALLVCLAFYLIKFSGHTA
jgi:hypothetical protein